jgi:DNA-binding transcriptional MerR regulator
MKTYSVRQAAKLAGIDPQTLFRWIWLGKVKPSIAVPMNGRRLYRFTEIDVRQLLDYKAAHYRKGRGRKKKTRK